MSETLQHYEAWLFTILVAVLILWGVVWFFLPTFRVLVAWYRQRKDQS